ncbi:hypothetical protein [Streptomyces sp. HUAS TT7]|uniref:hypothetical protein n=1 Tax=Streptomyces sp. HUAS TT7 TaxID=3447507 RepID=UPI003F65B498
MLSGTVLATGTGTATAATASPSVARMARPVVAVDPIGERRSMCTVYKDETVVAGGAACLASFA